MFFTPLFANQIITGALSGLFALAIIMGVRWILRASIRNEDLNACKVTDMAYNRETFMYKGKSYKLRAYIKKRAATLTKSLSMPLEKIKETLDKKKKDTSGDELSKYDILALEYALARKMDMIKCMDGKLTPMPWETANETTTAAAAPSAHPTEN